MIGDLELQPLEGFETTAESSFETGPGEAASEIDTEPDEERPLRAGAQRTPHAEGDPIPDFSIEGLMPSAQDEVVPDPLVGIDPRSMDSVFDSADPLAGLSVLEDDRWYQDNPLAGLTPKDPAKPVQASVPPAPPPPPAAHVEPSETEAEDIEALELDVEKTDREEDSEESEREEKAASRPGSTRESEREPARTRPKLVEDEDAPSGSAERKQSFPFNPFKRNAQTKKQAQRPTTPRAEVPKVKTPRKNQPAPSSAKNPQQGSRKGADADFVDLADWLHEDSGKRSYRMVAKDDKRIGDEQADFTDMLEKFKAGVAANVGDEDFDSHYDLGIAYREMGLIDEAVAEFQKALRGATQRIRAYEALGQCFIDRSEYDVAITVLSRALREPDLEDDDLIGVLYLLGFAAEENGQPRDASAYYQRVFAIDIDFRDVSKRLKAMSKAAAK
jgi:tetratricopeptide (TPR) repeat protein